MKIDWRRVGDYIADDLQIKLLIWGSYLFGVALIAYGIMLVVGLIRMAISN